MADDLCVCTASHDTGTVWYLAPDVLRMSYGTKADVWSVGVLAYELFTARLPFLEWVEHRS